MTSADDDLERLQRRLERERRARRQAEIIAERGMRELWEMNAGLLERVRTRTVEIECSIRAIQLVEHARWRTIDRLIGSSTPDTQAPDAGAVDEDAEPAVWSRVRSLLGAARPRFDVDAPTEVDPIDFADRLLERWQHPAARSGQLLSIEVAEDAAAVACDWALVQAIADTWLDECLRYAVPGALSVVLASSSDGVRLTIRDGGPGPAGADWGDREGPVAAWSGHGRVGGHDALVEALAEDGAATWSLERDGAATVRSVFVPASG